MSLQEEDMIFGVFAVAAKTGLSLTYIIPRQYLNIEIGQLCFVPILQKKFVALFVGFCEKPSFNCVEINGFFPYTTKIPAKVLEVLQWIAEYYLIPFEKMVPCLAPSFIWNTDKHNVLFKRLAKILLFDNDSNKYKLLNPLKRVKNNPIAQNKENILTQEQNNVFQALCQQQVGVCVLHGVTGSGKTEIYLKIAQHVVAQNKTVLVLVPEIALTPQMSVQFRSIFADSLAILHSGLNSTEYEKEWFKIHLGFAKIVLGVRTSVFCLLENIGLIIVDEEHDCSYKAQEFPGFHARDVAVLRAKKENALCILGSATPSVETMFNVFQKKYCYYKLENKFSQKIVESLFIDSKNYLNLPNKIQKSTYPLRSSQITFENHDGFSPQTIELIKQKWEQGQQSIVILNRRGFVNFALCACCSTPLQCPSCSVTTTLHHYGQVEICHYCDFRTSMRKSCPSCGSAHFIHKGVGTQNIEEQLRVAIPGLKTARLDRDVLTSHSRLTQIIETFKCGDVDCLVGTQMLAKGHDFPNVTLVVVLHIEDSLFLPDFRAAERTFQLLTQAMGRAGRGTENGLVVVQSLLTEHPIVTLSLQNNVRDFIERELEFRKMGFHPPFSRQVLLELRHKNKDKAMSMGVSLREALMNFWQQNQYKATEVRLGGPYPAPLEKLNNEYRIQICVSSVKEFKPIQLIPSHILTSKEFIGFLRVDVDPYSFI
ncbi:MAG: primosomal protein N' [Spirobacillus cienkowskii]|jgi:primosomal protein N' (replication factor Y)|uniref:Replication restart protein PriA n=1 Tax=Spirobacillus cienkowskii TaxID=495820 RepID=A0A369KR46_9BACT|nr:MAG: primosomal protein N' [Spirobacillus cienkowskii]